MESNKEFLKYSCYGLAILSAFINFSLYLTIFLSGLITLVFLAPMFDMSDDYAKMLATNEWQEETAWKIGFLVMNFFTLVHILYKPVSMLFE